MRLSLVCALALAACGKDEVRSHRLSAVPCASCNNVCVEEAFAIDDASHQTGDITYDDPPPTGGPHNPCWLTWGVHSSEAPVTGWVHNLEHGGVVFLYNCSDCASEVAAMTTFVDAHPGTTLLTPYSALPVRWAAVSWGHRLMLGCFDEAALEAFYGAHVDQAPESITSDPPSGC